jgi:hypothetical protein
MSRLLLGIGAIALGVAVSAQGTQEQPSLGAVAKAAQEEKAKANGTSSRAPAKGDATAKATSSGKTEKAPAKKYTNQDLGATSPSPWYPASYSTSAASGKGLSGDRSKGESYWRSRATPLRQRLEASVARASAMKARLDGIKAEGPDISTVNGRPSMVQAERQRLTSQLMEAEAQVEINERALKALEEEGRRAGALPGWFR